MPATASICSIRSSSRELSMQCHPFPGRFAHASLSQLPSLPPCSPITSSKNLAESSSGPSQGEFPRKNLGTLDTPLQQGQLAILPGCGHVVLECKGPFTNEAVRAFLDQPQK